MPRLPFEQLPDSARIWVFAGDRPLAPREADRLLAVTDTFLDQWAAHGVALRGSAQLLYDRFLVVAVDEAAAGVSGCSIDALTRQLKGLETELGVSLLDHGPVLFRDGKSIARVTRREFEDLVSKGRVSPDTCVFDTTVRTLADVRSGRWEGPARLAWHGRAFFEA